MPFSSVDFTFTSNDLVARRDRTKGLPWGAKIVGRHTKNDELVVYEQRGVYNGEVVFCGLCGWQPQNTQDAVKKHTPNHLQQKQLNQHLHLHPSPTTCFLHRPPIN
jgi:hypothetical protein